LLFPAIVAVTEQSPAESLESAPLVIEHPAPVVEYETEPLVVPPDTANVIDEPYVPETDVMVKLL
jgi:hypothetical protein